MCYFSLAPNFRRFTTRILPPTPHLKGVQTQFQKAVFRGLQGSPWPKLAGGASDKTAPPLSRWTPKIRKYRVLRWVKNTYTQKFSLFIAGLTKKIKKGSKKTQNPNKSGGGNLAPKFRAKIFSPAGAWKISRARRVWGVQSENAPYLLNFILSCKHGACAIFAKIMGRGSNAPYSLYIHHANMAHVPYSPKSLNDLSMF